MHCGDVDDVRMNTLFPGEAKRGARSLNDRQVGYGLAWRRERATVSDTAKCVRGSDGASVAHTSRQCASCGRPKYAD